MSLGLFAAAVAVRLAALAILGLQPQRFEYEQQALSLLAGEGYRRIHLGTPHLAFGPPLYGFLCAGLYRVFGHHPLPVILAQIGASSLIPVVIARIAGEVGLDRRLRWIAAAPAVVHPGLVVYAVRKLHPLSFDALFLSLTVLSVLRLAPAAGLGAHVTGGHRAGARDPDPRHRRGVRPSRRPVARLDRAGGQRGGAPPPASPCSSGRRPSWSCPGPRATTWCCTDSSSSRRIPPSSSGAGTTRSRRAPRSSWTDARSSRGRRRPFRREILARDELGPGGPVSPGGPRVHAGAARGVRRGRGPQVRVVLVVSGHGRPHVPGRLARRLPVVLRGAPGRPPCSARSSPGGAPIEGGRQRLVLLLAMLASISVAQSLFYVEVRHRWAVEPLLGIFLAAR